MSKKLAAFLQQPIDDYQSIRDVPGIGQKTLDQLYDANVKKTKELYEIFQKHPDFVSFNRAVMRLYEVSLPKATFTAFIEYDKKYNENSSGSQSTSGQAPKRVETRKSAPASTFKAPRNKPLKRLQNSTPTTTKKYELFIEEPLGEKAVNSIPGIGPTTAKSLKNKKITKAYQIFGEYLRCGKDDFLFTKWMTSVQANTKFIQQCIDAMKHKCEMI